MAKAAMVQRELKRQRLHERYRARREALKQVANDPQPADGGTIQGAVEAGQASP